MKNYVNAGSNVTLAAPATVVSGDGVLIGSIFGIAAGDAAIGAELDLVTEGVFTMPKVSALAIAIGDKLYWDNAAKLVNKTPAGNTFIGAAVSVAGSPSATVDVRLNGVAV